MTGVLLGIGLFFQSVSAEEPLGQFISYEIEDYGEYEDSQTDLAYVFTKGIFSSYSDSTESMVLTRQNGEDTCCKYCEKNLFGKTAIDYVKLYEGMGISANIFEEFHVAHDYGEVPLP